MKQASKQNAGAWDEMWPTNWIFRFEVIVHGLTTREATFSVMNASSNDSYMHDGTIMSHYDMDSSLPAVLC
jgi:hypothetical protein